MEILKIRLFCICLKGLSLLTTQCDCCWQSICLCPMNRELYDGVETMFETTQSMNPDELFLLAKDSFSNYTDIYDNLQACLRKCIGWLDVIFSIAMEDPAFNERFAKYREWTMLALLPESAKMPNSEQALRDI